jgi:hypothetical protein
VAVLADKGSKDFLTDCAVIPSLEVAGYLGGHEVGGAIVITRHLTGRLAPRRVSVPDLGAHLGALAAAR